MQCVRRLAFATTFFIGCVPLPAQQSDPTVRYALGFSETFIGANPNVTRQDGSSSATIDCQELWPGISLRLTTTGQGIEHQFTLQPGANPDNIAIRYEGFDGLTIDAQGSLVVRTAEGTLRSGQPNGAQYRMIGPATVGLQFDGAAREYPLVIRPTVLEFSRSTNPSTAPPAMIYFDVAPTSTLPGQAVIGTFLITGATSATLNGVEAGCGAGKCGGTVLFNPTATTTYVLNATGAGGNISSSQTVEVGKYQSNPPPLPAGLEVTWQGACWIKHLPKADCNGACQGMAFSVNIPVPPADLPLEATLYLNSKTCNPASQDNLNDIGSVVGSGGWLFWFINHPNLQNSSAIWTIGNQSSGCVSYAKAPACQ